MGEIPRLHGQILGGLQMTKTLLFLTLMLFAPVAGAELDQKQICSVMGCYAQPAEELHACITADNCPCGRNPDCSCDTCWFTEDQPAEEAKQSDAEKWRDDCDRFIKLYETTNHATYLNKADIYCTRAILEEMRNK